MFQTLPHPSRAVLALLLLCAMVAAGCGDSPEPPQTAKSSPVSNPPSPTPTLQSAPDVKPERRVEGNTLISTARPSVRIHVAETLQYQGMATNLDISTVKKLPVAVSVDTAQAYVFAQAPGGLLKRAVVFTVLDAIKRGTLPAEDLSWMPSPIERGRQRSAGQEYLYVAGALEEPFEYYVANLLEDKGIRWAGCHLVTAMHRDFSSQSRVYVFYIEQLEGACGDWQKPFDELDAPSKERFSAFFLNLLKFVQFQP